MMLARTGYLWNPVHRKTGQLRSRQLKSLHLQKFWAWLIWKVEVNGHFFLFVRNASEANIYIFQYFADMVLNDSDSTPDCPSEKEEYEALDDDGDIKIKTYGSKKKWDHFKMKYNSINLIQRKTVLNSIICKINLQIIPIRLSFIF